MFKFLKENINVSCGDVSALRDYIAYLAHEIKTPLNSIYGNLEILRMEAASDNSINMGYIDNAILSAEYLTQLLDSAMLVFAMENDKSVIKTEALTVEELLKYPKGILGWAAKNKSIKLQFLFGETLYPYLYLNRAVIQQIVVNLVSNAIKYTNEGGSVICRISQEYLEEKRVKLYIEVEDDGIGMEEDFILHACDKFSREGRWENAGGNGLGLFITKHFTELLKGNIKIETKVNCGTRVRVELEADGDDVIYDAESFAKKGEEDTWERGNSNEYILPKRVLAAEDEIANMEIICKYFKILGIDADKAYDGDEVVEIYKKSEENYYDVILIDMNLPKKSGIEAIREIRSLDRTDNKLPIIVMTADIPDIQKTDILCEEINGCITKPYSLEDIRSALSKYWERQAHGIRH